MRAAGNERKVVQAGRRNMVRRISTPTAIFFAVKPPPRPIASTSRATSEDGDTGGAADPARARGWFLNPAPTTLVGDLRLEPLSRLLRVSRECEPGQVVPFREDVLRLPKEHANFGRTEVVRLRLLQNGLARADDRLGLLDLGLAELHRPLDLSLLGFPREPLRP